MTLIRDIHYLSKKLFHLINLLPKLYLLWSLFRDYTLWLYLVAYLFLKDRAPTYFYFAPVDKVLQVSRNLQEFSSFVHSTNEIRLSLLTSCFRQQGTLCSTKIYYYVSVSKEHVSHTLFSFSSTCLHFLAYCDTWTLNTSIIIFTPLYYICNKIFKNRFAFSDRILTISGFLWETSRLERPIYLYSIKKNLLLF